MPEGISTEGRKEGYTEDKSLGGERGTGHTEPDLSCRSCRAADSPASGTEVV